MFRNLRSGGIDLPARSVAPSVLTRPNISIKGKWHYLYRAVDKQGRSVDFRLRPDRALPLHRRSFGGRSPRIRIELRARSHSMAMHRATERCDFCDASTLLGAESEFGVRST